MINRCNKFKTKKNFISIYSWVILLEKYQKIEFFQAKKEKKIYSKQKLILIVDMIFWKKLLVMIYIYHNYFEKLLSLHYSSFVIYIIITIKNSLKKF